MNPRMNPARLRWLIRRYGNVGVLLVSYALILHHLWTKRRVPLLAGLFVLMMTPVLLWPRHSAPLKSKPTTLSSPTQPVAPLTPSAETVTAKQERLDHALIAAIKDRDEDRAIRLLQQGADPNARDAPLKPDNEALRNRLYTPTALTLVFDTDPWYDNGHCRPGNEMARLVHNLLKYGANPQVQDSRGDPALVAAVRLRYVQNTRSLLQYGADPNACDAEDRTALMVGTEDVEIVNLLLAAGAQTEQRDKQGVTALLQAVHNIRFDNRPEIVHALLSHGANINATDREGNSAIMASASDGDADTIRLLLSAHARLDFRNRAGLTALGLAKEGVREMVAGNAGWKQAVRLLQKAGAQE